MTTGESTRRPVRKWVLRRANIGGEDSIRSAYGRMRSALPVATWRYAFWRAGRQRSGGCSRNCSDKQSSSCEGPLRVPPRTSKNDSNGSFTIPPSLSLRYQPLIQSTQKKVVVKTVGGWTGTRRHVFGRVGRNA